MTQHFAGPSQPPSVRLSAHAEVRLCEADEIDMCRHVAELELAGDYFAAAILRDEYDLDDVWIEDIKAEMEGRY
jgi:hypothetical protein